MAATYVHVIKQKLKLIVRKTANNFKNDKKSNGRVKNKRIIVFMNWTRKLWVPLAYFSVFVEINNFNIGYCTLNGTPIQYKWRSKQTCPM